MCKDDFQQKHCLVIKLIFEFSYNLDVKNFLRQTLYQYIDCTLENQIKQNE